MAASFVPAADEVWRLQRGDDADCRFFQRAVNGGELITDKGTRQGIWVLSPSGRLLSRINSNDPDRVLPVLARGLAAWSELPEEERRLAADAELEPELRWEHSYPEDGLVLERIARDLAAESPVAAPLPTWNRDFAWFTREEARDWLPAEPRSGDVHAVPPISVRRLARFHLVDNARGQTLPYAEEEIEAAELTTRVLLREGETVELELRGRTRATAAGPWLLGDNLWTPRHEHPHGIETELFGRATFDLAREAFTAFELVARGRRWGRTAMNGRRNATEGGRIGFHFQLATDAPRIAPTFISLYNADWVRRPEGWAYRPENRVGDDPIRAMLGAVSAERIHERIAVLAGFYTRHTASETESDERGIGAARRWIESDLRASAEASGGRLEVGTHSTTRRMGSRDVEIVNVYGFLPGKQDDPRGRTYVVLGHYDSRASGGMDAEAHAPGADDDASGTAVVLELARVMSQHELEANLYFVCVAGEEQGLFGSKAFAEWMESEGVAIDGVITNDIVGGIEGGNGVVDDTTIRCFSGGDGLSGASRDFARDLYDAAERYVPDARVRMIFRLDRRGRGGDHIPFHERGIPALRLTEANENYARQHQDVREEDGVQYGDVLEHVSADYVAKVARVNGALLARLALAPAPPSRLFVRGALRYDTTLAWQASPSESAVGYVAVWRETTSPIWEHKSEVFADPRAVLEGVIADNFFFGVRAVDAAGNESRTIVPERRR